VLFSVVCFILLGILMLNERRESDRQPDEDSPLVHPACQLIADALEQLRDVRMFEEIASEGLRVATEAKELHQLLMENSKLPDENPVLVGEDAVKRVEAQAQWAEAEERDEFPYLHGLLCIRIWAILDAVVDDLVAMLLADPSKYQGQEIVRKIKVPVVDFTAASDEEKAEMVLQEYKRNLGASLKPGVGRFESMLDPLGLGGPVDDVVRRTLLECSQARHVLVHRAGFADPRLVKQCPEMNLEVGDPVEINHEQFIGFQLAADWYLYS
jgi:hypothetical protein